MLTIDTANRTATLMLPHRADVSSALDLHQVFLRTQVGVIDTLDIDASEVAKLDAAVLQLLVAWLAVLDSHHIPWHWQGASETFQQVVALAGLSAALRFANEQFHENAGH